MLRNSLRLPPAICVLTPGRRHNLQPHPRGCAELVDQRECAAPTILPSICRLQKLLPSADIHIAGHIRAAHANAYRGQRNRSVFDEWDLPTIGVLGTFRQQFRPWFGYSLNLGYTQAAERYTGTTPPVAPFGISDAGVLDLRKAMPTTAAARKQVGRFIPSADPRHRPRPFELLGLQCRDVQSVLDAISSGLRWSSVLASRVIRVLPKHSWRSISACVHGPLLLGKRGVSYASTRPSACFGLRRSTAAFHAREWLLSAVRGLNNKRPIDYTRTDFGAREVAV